MPIPRSTMRNETAPAQSLPSTTDEAMPLDVRVVAHTHWDREWYHAAPRFRQRLVALVDALLELPRGASRPFLLDGQAVVLEDYLSVRPERAGEIESRLMSGDFEAGPWYVLADNLIPSGEAIVRNLLEGRRVLGRLGGEAPAVAYCPDTFGHPAALPIIATGFGLKLAIVWRGFGGVRAQSGDTFRWQAANGDSVVMYHLPPDGYETGCALPTDIPLARERWSTLGALLRARCTFGVTLLQNGADHHALQPHIHAAIEALRTVSFPDVIRRDSLSGFANALLAAVDASLKSPPVITGELRNSYGYTWTLQGTLATRAGQKRANARAERTLIRDVEPWMVLAWMHGSAQAHSVSHNAQITLATAPALLGVAWRELLRAHPHDTLCGCSIDSVARAMDERLESVQTQAGGLRAAALAMALHHDVVASRSQPVNAGVVVVRNRSARVRSGVAEVIVYETVADVAVGPGSAASSQIARAVVAPPHIGHVVMQFGKSRMVYRRRESPQHYPDNDLVRAHYALAWVERVPALGLQTHQLIAGQSSDADLGDSAISDGDLPQAARARVANGEVEMTNGILTVRVTAAGVSVTRDGRVIENAISLVTERDVGDAYTPALRGDAEPLTLQSFRGKARGPLRASVEIIWTTSGKKRRIRVATTLVLDAGAEILRIDIAGENKRRDHRLRFHLQTDVATTAAAREALRTHTIEEEIPRAAAVPGEIQSRQLRVFADAAYGTVLRTPLSVPFEQQRAEGVITTMPMHRWVCVSSNELGATMHSDGLAEAEVLHDGTLALTLLRSIGALSRNDLDERPGHAGWPAPIPLAQSQGPFRARVGLQLHAAWSDNVQQRIETASDSLLLPLVGHTIRDLSPATRAEVPGVELEGSCLRMSAVKLADDGDGVVLRCINDSNEACIGAWVLPKEDAWEVARSRLDETPLESWRASASRIAFIAGANAVETIRVRRRAR
jgi:mannosylglycerate hydrolase